MTESQSVFRFDSQATYSAAAIDYEYATANYWPRLAEHAVNLAGVGPNMTVLDVACGSGALTFPAAVRVRPNGRVVAVDFSPEQLALATHRASRLAMNNIDWRMEDMTVLDLPPESFDVVLCGLGLFAAEDMAGLTARLWRLVCRGGRIAFVTLGREPLFPLCDLFLAAARNEKPDLLHVLPWERSSSAESMTAILRDAGIHDVTVTEERIAAPLRDPNDWWRLVRGTWLRDILTQLSDEAAARVRVANLCAIAEHDIRTVRTTFLHTVARKS